MEESDPNWCSALPTFIHKFPWNVKGLALDFRMILSTTFTRWVEKERKFLFFLNYFVYKYIILCYLQSFRIPQTVSPLFPLKSLI